MGAVVISKSPSVLVKPSSDPATSPTVHYIHVMGLSSYDELNVGRPVTAFLVFERPIDDPAETIRRGLSLALVPYYPMSGRLCSLFLAFDAFTAIDCTGAGDPEGAGVPFVVASADAALRDVDLHRHLEELAVFNPAADDPMPAVLLVQVTVFSCGGFVVGVTWDHSVADGAGMAQFLRAVGEQARGMPSPAVVPVRHKGGPKMPFSFERIGRLVNSLEPSQLTMLHLAVPYSLISRIKREFAALNSGHPCTVFEAVTAVLWRCRTRAVMHEDPSAPALLGFVADGRRHAGAKDGFYGSCSFLAPPVLATREAVAGGDIIDLIKMIRRAKDKIAGYYEPSKEGKDDDVRRLQELTDAGLLVYGNMLGVTCWRNLGMDKADLGGGTPARVMWYMKQGMGRLPFCVILPCGVSATMAHMPVNQCRGASTLTKEQSMDGPKV